MIIRLFCYINCTFIYTIPNVFFSNDVEITIRKIVIELKFAYGDNHFVLQFVL